MLNAATHLSSRSAILALSAVFYACNVSGPAQAEPVAFSGKVVDASGNPVPWALIQVQGSDLIGQSVADGTFNLTGTITADLYYADPRPAAPVFASVAAEPAPMYSLDGRETRGRVAAVLLLSRPGGDASPQSTSGSTRMRVYADQASEGAPGFAGYPDPRPPSAPRSAPPRGIGSAAIPPTPEARIVLAKSSAAASAAAAYTLVVTMAHYQDGSFPQAGATAKGLTLTLAASTTDTAMYAAEKKLCMDTINAYRASLGLKPVAWSKSLEAFADQGARYDSDRNQAHQHFGAFSKYAVPADAENALPGWPLKYYKTVAAIVAQGTQQMWAEGPGGGHYENIRGDQTELGCGIYLNKDGNVWVVQDFK